MKVWTMAGVVWTSSPSRFCSDPGMYAIACLIIFSLMEVKSFSTSSKAISQLNRMSSEINQVLNKWITYIEREFSSWERCLFSWHVQWFQEVLYTSISHAFVPRLEPWTAVYNLLNSLVVIIHWHLYLYFWKTSAGGFQVFVTNLSILSVKQLIFRKAEGA